MIYDDVVRGAKNIVIIIVIKLLNLVTNELKLRGCSRLLLRIKKLLLSGNTN